VTLLGDAAHPMLPNAAQGACQALEDAAALGEALAARPPEQALVEYEGCRLKRASRFVRQSRQTAQAVQSTNPVVVALRNLAAAHAPRSLMLRQLDATVRLSPAKSAAKSGEHPA
jgi:2-polyprenyl-6-methoxyphenol hydroxylase-like FAD-dependent oxidoreductase